MTVRGFLDSLDIAGIGSIALAGLLLSIAPAHADKRVALIIGNGAYVNAPHLPNPPHDAEDVAAALKRSNFEVIQGVDLDQAGMQDAIIRFARAAQAADVGVFYYSGHAMQFNGANYLMPVDAKLGDEADLYRFTRVDDVLGYLQQAKNLKILVLDSCRDNPLAQSFKRSIGVTRAIQMTHGLAKIEAPIGAIVAFSTQAGQQAEDGSGRNSPYTAAFLKHIDEPNEIGEIFRDISADVYRATGSRQLPELSLSIIGKFYLQGTVQVTVPQGAAPPDPAAQAWAVTKDTTSIAIVEDFIRQFGGTVYGSMARARLEELKKAQVAIVMPAPAAPSSLQPTAKRYVKAGNFACFSKAEYPDSWREEAPMCTQYGCNFGKMSEEACLALGALKGSKTVIHGKRGTTRANECWLQHSCGDLRSHGEFTLFKM